MNLDEYPPLPEQLELEPEPAPPEKPRRARFGTAFREIAETLLLALFIYLSVRAIVQNFKVEGSSMDPTLHHAQYLLVNKASYVALNLASVAHAMPALGSTQDGMLHPFGLPQRGDIIVFRYPRDPSRDFIKRVIGLPGDVVEIRDGVIMVNGSPISEPYIRDRPNYTYPAQTIPPDQYFVLGDNRNN